MRIGLDVGSTTLKCVVLDDSDSIVYKKYERHGSKIAERTAFLLRDAVSSLPGVRECRICISGSAGMGLAESLGIPFSQEVFATRTAVNKLCPGTDCVIELGGEDAKILFLTDAMEVRMNGSCAGGTGAFIDQMATLLNITPSDLDCFASKHKKLHSIASRCGVFAKSDIQALLNQGTTIEDISASIFYAVANQTVAGLAQGRRIGGRVLYLGGPLTFLPQLRVAFDDVLKVSGHLPEDSLYFVAYGAATMPDIEDLPILETAEKIGGYSAANGFMRCPPLFTSKDEYNEFKSEHDNSSPFFDKPSNKSGNDIENSSINNPEQEILYIGVDAGSTTVKCVAINKDGNIVFSRYVPNSGNPVPIVRSFLIELREQYPNAAIGGAVSTGYGEQIIKNAFRFDSGIVETIAHFTAAHAFDPFVDFIIDIGGQDIKCFRIKNGAIDNIFLNEACSSGCGSFLQAFAGALGYTADEFSKLGLYSEAPVDLGSRCTVFMNSSVKQAQKDGADIAAISAGLSISVVKNALYKVIRIVKPSDLGEHIVVQGGTFLNDAVLRAFEMETGRRVTRPPIAGIMGAYGAALYAKQALPHSNVSSILSRDELESFRYKTIDTVCKSCTNHCHLTINTFGGGRKYISGNSCERPLTGKAPADRLNMFEYKRSLLAKYMSKRTHDQWSQNEVIDKSPSAEVSADGRRGLIGIPVVLNMFEMLPFWHTFFTALGFDVATSGESTRGLYFRGQYSIPSDTVCYPAKLVHGHVEALIEGGVDAVFYPCLSYNFDEGKGDNHYNCPVVAYYPEVTAANIAFPDDVKFIYDYAGIHRKNSFPVKMQAVLAKYFPKIPLREVKKAAGAAYTEYAMHMERIKSKGDEMLALSLEKGMPVIVLAGRPYHIDPEVCHGIDSLICDYGIAVLSEDSVCNFTDNPKVAVLNQWTYHARMYAAAKFVAEFDEPDINLVQLVSFGCGLDAVTTDEMRSILEDAGKIYTQIKIDEITNLGAVRIRLRSLLAASRSLHKAGASR